MDIDYINQIAEGAIILDGFDDCIVGVSEEFGRDSWIIYSKQRIIQKLIESSDMNMDDAEEYYNYNILGGYFGERNPIFLISAMVG
jgi:hypothetical protein